MRKLSSRVLLHDVSSPPPPLEEGWISLPQIPGSAFGDGSHPTTRLCAGAVDLLCRQKKLQAVLDVGTGTGVLARIARARGALFVVGTDIDPASLEIAQKNAALDAGPITLILANAPPDHWGPRFHLIVANILEDPLRSLAGELAKALAPGGVLLLSGFTRLQVPFLRVVYEELSLNFMSESYLEDWALLMFRR